MKRLFDTFRSILGRGLTQAEVDRINAALGNTPVPEKVNVPESEWLELAEPLIHAFEGFATDIGGGKVRAYPDPGTGGAPWTIGYGTTGDDVKRDTVWTHEQAKQRSASDIAKFAQGVERAIGGMTQATPAQFAAMVSLAYNIGLGAFRRSTLLKRHQSNQFDAAAREFLRWNRAGGRAMRGLTRRRESEAALYRKGS